MDALWTKYPDMHPFSVGWRMGEGETYKADFWAWWDNAPEAKTEDTRLDYIKSAPMPPEWTHIALSMIWPEKIPGDEFGFFFHDQTAPLRVLLFAHGAKHGLPTLKEWMAGLDKAVTEAKA